MTDVIPVHLTVELLPSDFVGLVTQRDHLYFGNVGIVTDILGSDHTHYCLNLYNKQRTIVVGPPFSRLGRPLETWASVEPFRMKYGPDFATEAMRALGRTHVGFMRTCEKLGIQNAVELSRQVREFFNGSQ